MTELLETKELKKSLKKKNKLSYIGVNMSQAWWHMIVVPELARNRQDNQERAWGQSGLHKIFPQGEEKERTDKLSLVEEIDYKWYLKLSAEASAKHEVHH